MTKPEASTGAARRRVYCLCAQWCRVCDAWRPGFEALATALPQTDWVWVDVDAHDEVLDILDIQTFPVLLIAEGATALFCGPVEPVPAVVQRLLQGLTHPVAGLPTEAGELLGVLRDV